LTPTEPVTKFYRCCPYEEPRESGWSLGVIFSRSPQAQTVDASRASAVPWSLGVGTESRSEIPGNGGFGSGPKIPIQSGAPQREEIPEAVKQKARNCKNAEELISSEASKTRKTKK